MRTLNKSYARWIEAGYAQLGKTGHSGIHVEQLSKLLDLNKSGFYYYFGTREVYFDHLMDYHVRQAELLLEKLGGHRHPEFEMTQLFEEFKTFVLVHRQLLVSLQFHSFRTAYQRVNRMFESRLAESWNNFLDATVPPAIAMRFLLLVQERYLGKVTEEELSWPSVLAALQEARELFQQISQPQHQNLELSLMQ